MSMIVLALMLAITVEGVVEIGKSIGRAVLSRSYKTAITQVAALAIGSSVRGARLTSWMLENWLLGTAVRSCAGLSGSVTGMAP